MYVVDARAAFPKVPVPAVVQAPPVAVPPTEPGRFTLATSPHNVWSGLALAVGPGGMVMVTLVEAGVAHPPIALGCNVSVTVPAAISPAVGVYMAFKVFLFGLNVPAPPTQALGLPVPARFTGKLLVHTVCAGPALEVGLAVMVTTI